MSGRLWLSLCGLALSCSPVLADKDKDKDTAKPLPEKVVAAWTEAGAKVGWMGKNRFGFLAFRVRAKEGDVPAFFLSGRPKEGWDKLPAVDRPFGVFLVTFAGNADLKGLSSLEQLQSLALNNTKVTAAGLKHLASLKQLQSLSLYNTKVTDAGLKELVSLKRLQSLSLGGTKVTDAGLKHLVSLKQLQSLDLWGTKVTDAGLKHLASHQQLQVLYLGGTKVTAEGARQLKQALPKLRIDR